MHLYLLCAALCYTNLCDSRTLVLEQTHGFSALVWIFFFFTFVKLIYT